MILTAFTTCATLNHKTFCNMGNCTESPNAVVAYRCVIHRILKARDEIDAVYLGLLWYAVPNYSNFI